MSRKLQAAARLVHELGSNIIIRRRMRRHMTSKDRRPHSTYRAFLLLVLALAAACSSGNSAGPGSQATSSEQDGGCGRGCSAGPVADTPALDAGLFEREGGWLLRTEQVELGPAEERFYCYAVTLPKRLAIRRFSSAANPVVHHFLLVQALAPEPEGLRECDVLFQLTWAPLYPATRADSEIVLPEGSAKILPEDSQIVLQMHLLNTSPDPVRTQVEVKMEDAEVSDPTPVGITLFGDANFRLPPMQRTSAEHTCTLQHDISLYALLPHMHYLGRRLDLEIDRGNGFEPFYSRENFDFDDQYIDQLDQELTAGTRVKVRCVFENDEDHEIAFGEDSESEMCLAVGFRTGGGDEFEFCTDVPPEVGVGVPHDPNAGVCGEDETAEGLGRLCTQGGGECPEDLFCAADLLGLPEAFCFKVGCTSSDQCNGSRCCTLPILGDFANLCVPEFCRPDYCIPIEDQAGQ